MLSFISFITYGVGVALFYHLDGHRIVKNRSVIALQKFRKINRLVSTNNKGCLKILWISFYMIFQALYMSLSQYLNNTIKPLGENRYLVSYIIKGNTYKMIVKLKKGPRSILLVSDEKQNDVSDLILPYLGPDDNFHGYHYTPGFFGKDELVFELSNGTEKIFRSDEHIKFE